MIKKTLFIASIFLIGVFFVSPAGAVSIFDITFPIPELGNCADQSSCKAYCDDEANRDACVDFGRQHGFIDEDEAERISKLPETGPGGCVGKDVCRDYCNDESHFDECLSFAEEHGLLPKEEIEKIKEFGGQTGPGGCRGANECRSYCESEDHLKECVEFAKRKGLISDRDAEVATEVAERGGPGGCRGEEACRTYCEDESNIEECLAFAEKHGFISSEEAAKIRQFGGGAGPGGCKREACKEYCNDPAHQEECIQFAVDKGFMTQEDAERARKLSSVTGPGGCRGQECRTYCDDPEKAEECLQFAEQQGLIKGEDAQKARKFVEAAKKGGPGGCRGRECANYCQSKEHGDECVKFAQEHGLLTAEDKARLEVGQKIQSKLQESGGPGGCKSEDECRAYCSSEDHAEECVAFAATHGGVSKEEAERMLQEFRRQKTFIEGEFGDEDIRRFEMESEKRFEEFRRLEERFRSQDRFEGAPGGEGFKQGLPGFEGSEEFRAPRQANFGADFSGPGGCKDPLECRKYCAEHIDECSNFAPPRLQPINNIEGGKGFGGQPDQQGGRQREKSSQGEGGQNFQGGSEFGKGGDFSGPGGCKSPEECKEYCAEHQDECAGSGGPGVPRLGIPSVIPNLRATPREPLNMQDKFSQPAGCRSPEECAQFRGEQRNIPQVRQFDGNVLNPNSDQFKGSPAGDYHINTQNRYREPQKSEPNYSNTYPSQEAKPAEPYHAPNQEGSYSKEQYPTDRPIYPTEEPKPVE